MNNKSSNKVQIKNLLKNELDARIKRNKKYSIRAFARDLQVSPSSLIDVLNGNEGISQRRAVSIATRIYNSADEIDFFVTVAIAEFGRGEKARDEARKKLKNLLSAKSFFSGYSESFKFFSDWRNLAIYEFAKLSSFDGTISWLVKRTGLNKMVVEESVQQMQEYGLAKLSEKNQKIEICSKNMRAHLPNNHVEGQKLCIDLMYKSKESLIFEEDIQKVFTSHLLPINIKKYPQIRNQIVKFVKSLIVEQDKHKSLDQVYCLGLQFFPIGRKES